MLHQMTITELLKETGISRATIYRYFSDPQKVSVKNRIRIEQALEQQKVTRELHLESHKKKIVYIVPGGEREYFFDEMAHNIEKYCQLFSYHVEIVRIKSTYVQKEIKELTLIINEKAMHADLLILTLHNIPQFSQCVHDLVQKGVKVITLIADLPHSKRQLFIGIDNFAAGRTAGLLLTALLGERILKKKHIHLIITTPSSVQEDLVQRVVGFRSYIATALPNAKIEVLEIINQEDSESLQMLHQKLLSGEIDAIYSTPISNHLLTQALHITKTANIPVVSHELTTITQRSLLDGSINFILRQHTDSLAAKTVQMARALLRNQPIEQKSIIESVHIISAENIPLSVE